MSCLKHEPTVYLGWAAGVFGLGLLLAFVEIWVDIFTPATMLKVYLSLGIILLGFVTLFVLKHYLNEEKRFKGKNLMN
jgi:hypothetical protein